MKTPTDPLLVFCMMAEKIFLAYLLHKSIKFGKNEKKNTTRFNKNISNYRVNTNQDLTVKSVTNATDERMPMARDLSSVTTITQLAGEPIYPGYKNI